MLESGDVTYTYEVRNTGDVPLADVKASITDDKCAPVTYVSGDEDGDELLDTPNSIFEDSADEVWMFTCTARITTDTVNIGDRVRHADRSGCGRAVRSGNTIRTVWWLP